MLKTLIKKQLLELNRSFFIDRKTGKGKSARSATFSIVLFILLMIFAIGGIFCYMSYSMRPLITYGMSWLYFAIMGATAALFGVFGSVFNTYSSLYDAKDNDLLLSMPIPVRDIMAARLIGVYLMGLMYSGVVVIPAVGVYFVNLLRIGNHCRKYYIFTFCVRLIVSTFSIIPYQIIIAATPRERERPSFHLFNQIQVRGDMT